MIVVVREFATATMTITTIMTNLLTNGISSAKLVTNMIMFQEYFRINFERTVEEEVVMEIMTPQDGIILASQLLIRTHSTLIQMWQADK